MEKAHAFAELADLVEHSPCQCPDHWQVNFNTTSSFNSEEGKDDLAYWLKQLDNLIEEGKVSYQPDGSTDHRQRRRRHQHRQTISRGFGHQHQCQESLKQSRTAVAGKGPWAPQPSGSLGA